MPLKKDDRSAESGNVLIIILLAIVLIGALTAAIQNSSQSGANIDKETLLLRATEIQNYDSLKLTDGSNYKKSFYGTISYMPAIFGLNAASEAIRLLFLKME